MRRTSLMVLVPALVFAGLLVSAPPMQAQSGTARHAKHTKQAAHKEPAHHRAPGSGSSGRASHPVAHASVHVSARQHTSAQAHAAPYRAGRRGHGTAVNARRLSRTETRPDRNRAYRSRAERLTASLTRPRASAPFGPQPLPRSTHVPVEAASLAAIPAPAQFIAAPTHPLARGAMPPPLRGSLVSLERQNAMADAEGLERIEDEADLSDRIAHGLLVPVPVSASMSVNGNLPEHHRYCRPWTARFLSDLSAAFAAQFRGGSLEVSSAVRTVAYQKRLMGVNGNAAPAEGDIVSPHLTGATIDIAKHSLTAKQIGWMRAWLLPLQDAGKLDVEEEFQQSCFHITVYKGYVAPRPPMSIARTRAPRSGTAQPGTLQPGTSGAGLSQSVTPQVKPAMATPAAPTPAQGHVRPALSDLASATPPVSR